MGTVAMSGDDTLIINDISFADLATGVVSKLTFPNEIASVKVGKNGNAIYGLNEMGNVADMELHLIRGSADDKNMNALLANQKLNFAGFALLSGQFIKKIGNGKGQIANDTYDLGGGVFVKNVEAESNVEGSPDQSVSSYKLKFSTAPRAIT